MPARMLMRSSAAAHLGLGQGAALRSNSECIGKALADSVSTLKRRVYETSAQMC